MRAKSESQFLVLTLSTHILKLLKTVSKLLMESNYPLMVRSLNNFMVKHLRKPYYLKNFSLNF